MLRVESLTVSYARAQILQKITFLVTEKNLTAILGSNGAGKSTILNCVAGLLAPKSGSIIFKGQEISDRFPFQRVEMGISLIPERRRLFPYLTVKENLQMGAYAKRARKQAPETMERTFELFPRLLERHKQHVGTLSGGEQQMVAIARGLMSRPELLMVDEPSVGLAPMITSEVFRLLKEINNTGITILLVEQNAYHSLRIAETAFVLENGKIVMEGSSSEIVKEKSVKKAYLGL